MMLEELSRKLEFEHEIFTPIMRAKLLDDALTLGFEGNFLLMTNEQFV